MDALLLVRFQVITRANIDLLLIAPKGETAVKFQSKYIFSCEKMDLKMSYARCRSFCLSLTHLGGDKMDAVSQTAFSSAIFVNKNRYISIKISLKFVPNGLISNIPVLVQIMACCRPGDKPLSKAMMAWVGDGSGWGCEVSCGGHHRQRGKTTIGSALGGAVLDFTQILAYLVHNVSRSQLYLGFGHFGWLPSFFGQLHFGGFVVKLYFIYWNYSLSSGWHIVAAKGIVA